MPESLTGSFCEFYAKSDHVMKIDVSQNVTISRKVHSIFIQTDKGIYKPGQKGALFSENTNNSHTWYT